MLILFCMTWHFPKINIQSYLCPWALTWKFLPLGHLPSTLQMSFLILLPIKSPRSFFFNESDSKCMHLSILSSLNNPQGIIRLQSLYINALEHNFPKEHSFMVTKVLGHSERRASDVQCLLRRVRCSLGCTPNHLHVTLFSGKGLESSNSGYQGLFSAAKIAV